MFSTRTESFGGFPLIILINELTSEQVGILPEQGASIDSLTLSCHGRLHEIIEGYEDFIDFLENREDYRGSVLFPFPNRINNGIYTFGGKTYQLPINEAKRGHALHGLVSEKKFTIDSQIATQDHAELHLTYEMEDLEPGYPFKTRLNITYQLSEKGLEIAATITNVDSMPIPIGLGWHPYFKIEGKDIDELLLKLPKSQLIDTDEGMIPTGLFVEEHNYQGVESLKDVDADIGLRMNANCLAELLDPNLKVGIRIWQDDTNSATLQYLQVYTPTHRKSIAIEPQTCAADAFNNGHGLIILQPEANVSVKWGISLYPIEQQH